MTEKFRASEATEWNSHGHLGRGKVRKKLTQRTLLKGNAYLGDEAREDTKGEASAGPAAGESSAGPGDGSSSERS